MACGKNRYFTFILHVPVLQYHLKEHSIVRKCVQNELATKYIVGIP